MKPVKMSVDVKYSVSGTFDISDEDFEKLYDVYGDEITPFDVEHSDAIEWLVGNIQESDALDLSYEVTDLNEVRVVEVENNVVVRWKGKRDEK